MSRVDSVARILALANGGSDQPAGTKNYNELLNKPTINKVELVGNKTFEDLGVKINELDKAQTITGLKTYSVLPQSSVVPVNNNDLSNKKYVDDSIANIDIPSNAVTTDTAQTITGAKIFSAAPKTNMAPVASDDMVNKAYVDTILANYTGDVNARLAQLTTPVK